MTDQTDFFGQGESDHTVFVPRPGNRRPRQPGSAPSPAPSQAPSPLPNEQVQAAALNQGQTQNLILSAATPLITLGSHLRTTNHVADSNALFQQICNDIKQLDQELQRLGVSKEHTVTTRYLVCSYIDEMVMSTPWGAQSTWTQRGLLMVFHNNALGGVKFFDIVNLLLQNPASNTDLLELCYIMLSLGFEGKFRFADGGRHELTRIIDNLYSAIQTHRAEVNKQLSVDVSGIEKSHTLLADNRLMWGILLSCVALLVVVFTTLFFRINHASDPVAIQTSALGSNIEQLVRKPRATNKKVLSANISHMLASDIENGNVAINTTGNSVQITVSGKGLFNPASAQIAQDKRALLKRVSDAIASEPGSISVIGHTDNTPIRTLQFPSNWQLSTKRAESIAHFLQTQMPDRRITTEGRADLQPLVPNNSPENRATNRRVEINLFLN